MNLQIKWQIWYFAKGGVAEIWWVLRFIVEKIQTNFLQIRVKLYVSVRHGIRSFIYLYVFQFYLVYFVLKQHFTWLTNFFQK